MQTAQKIRHGVVTKDFVLLVPQIVMMVNVYQMLTATLGSAVPFGDIVEKIRDTALLLHQSLLLPHQVMNAAP